MEAGVEPCGGKMSAALLVWGFWALMKNPSPPGPAQPLKRATKRNRPGPTARVEPPNVRTQTEKGALGRLGLGSHLLERVPRSSPKPFPPPPPPPAKPFLPPPRAGHGARCVSNPRPPRLLQPQRGLPRAFLRGRSHQGMEPSELTVLAFALGTEAMG